VPIAFRGGDRVWVSGRRNRANALLPLSERLAALKNGITAVIDQLFFSSQFSFG
jgi:hypothetical protein